MTPWPGHIEEEQDIVKKVKCGAADTAWQLIRATGPSDRLILGWGWGVLAGSGGSESRFQPGSEKWLEKNEKYSGQRANTSGV